MVELGVCTSCQFHVFWVFVAGVSFGVVATVVAIFAWGDE